MERLDRKDLLLADLDTREVKVHRDIRYYNTDKQVAYIFMKAVLDRKEVKVSESGNFVFKMDVINVATNMIQTATGVLTDEFPEEEAAIWKFTLTDDFTNRVGKFICQTYVQNVDQLLIMDPFGYKVNKDQVTGLDPSIPTDPDLPILKQLIEEMKSLVAGATGIDDDNIDTDKTWSSEKINAELVKVSAIDDTVESLSKTWSSEKINAELSKAGKIDDTVESLSKTWSSEKIADKFKEIMEELDKCIKTR